VPPTGRHRAKKKGADGFERRGRRHATPRNPRLGRVFLGDPRRRGGAAKRIGDGTKPKKTVRESSGEDPTSRQSLCAASKTDSALDRTVIVVVAQPENGRETRIMLTRERPRDGGARAPVRLAVEGRRRTRARLRFAAGQGLPRLGACKSGSLTVILVHDGPPRHR